MTCIEKLREEHPEHITGLGSKSYPSDLCPTKYDYAPGLCTKDDNDYPFVCHDCWNQEVDGSCEPVIKDSGDRTQFETGAVRDMREGKGRCDLMPLEVVARCYEYFAYHSGDGDGRIDAEIFRSIRMFQLSNDTNYLVEALDYFQSLDKSWSNMFLEVAKHFEDGAKKYGENNWQKGIPVYCYIDSAVRHYLKWLRGDKDEPHDRAFVWNIMCCIWEVDYGAESRKECSD